jgi:hypothetical protein
MGETDQQTLMATGWHEFDCEAYEIVFVQKNREHMFDNEPGSNRPAPNSPLWRNLSLDNTKAVPGSLQEPASAAKAKALAELGVSPVWIEHIINGTVPRIDAKERRKIIEDAVEEMMRQIADELIHTYRPSNRF